MASWLPTVTLLQVAAVEVVVEAEAREPAASHAFMPRHWCQRILNQVWLRFSRDYRGDREIETVMVRIETTEEKGYIKIAWCLPVLIIFCIYIYGWRSKFLV